MTAKIKRSDINAYDHFDDRALRFSAELSQWLGHMAKVAEDEKRPEVKKPEWSDFANSKVPHKDFAEANAKYQADQATRHKPYPRPQAEPLIEAAVNERGLVDYEVIEDGPSDEDILNTKKLELYRQINAKEIELTEAVWPMAKRRYWTLLTADALRVEPTKRTQDQINLLEEADERAKKIEAIQRWAAKMHHDISDETLDSIDGWKPEEISI